MHDDDELTPDERDAFTQLPRTTAPSAAFEERVVEQLRAQGSIAPTRVRRPPIWQVAAAIVLLAGGFAAGRQWSRTEVPSPATSAGTRQYMLLLYGGATTSAGDERARVTEYGNWARAEAQAGRMILGERLGEPVASLGNEFGGPDRNKQPSGFFLIRATSMGEAAETASRCPHVKHGGTVVVQAIE